MPTLTRNKADVRNSVLLFGKRLIPLSCLKHNKFDFLVNHKIFNFNLKVYGKVLFPGTWKERLV